MKLAVNQVVEISNRFTNRVYQFTKTYCRHYKVRQIVNGVEGSWQRISMEQMEMLIIENTGKINTPTYTAHKDDDSKAQWQIITTHSGNLAIRWLDLNGEWTTLESITNKDVFDLFAISSVNNIKLSCLGNEIIKGSILNMNLFIQDLNIKANDWISIYHDSYSACYYSKSLLSLISYTEGDTSEIICINEDRLDKEIQRYMEN